MRSDTIVTNGMRWSAGPEASCNGSTSSQRRSGLPMSVLIGSALDPAVPVDPSPPRMSGWPSAKTRQPPANAHSAGGGDGVRLGGGPALDETGGRLAIDGAAVGDRNTHCLTPGAPQKTPTQKGAAGGDSADASRQCA